MYTEHRDMKFLGRSGGSVLDRVLQLVQLDMATWLDEKVGQTYNFSVCRYFPPELATTFASRFGVQVVVGYRRQKGQQAALGFRQTIYNTYLQRLDAYAAFVNVACKGLLTLMFVM